LFLKKNRVFSNPGFRIRPVPMTPTGVDTEALEQAVRECRPTGSSTSNSTSGRFWGMFYTISTFHNPTGITMSLSTCKTVVDIAAKNNLLVVCDDVYNLLRYDDAVDATTTTPSSDDDQPPSRLKAVDPHGLVVSIGTFSKILSPGIRLGWLELPPALVTRFTNSGILLSGGAVNNYMSGIVASLLQLNLLGAHLDMLLDVYRDRMDAMHGYLAENLPGGWQVGRPGGGYFLWVRADRPLAEAEYAALESRGVRVLRGRRACPHNYLGTECERQAWRN
jgi:DNA-binding transcriptional MocR family regulator